MRVLIADDSIILVDRLKSRLEEIEGVELVGYARTAAEASTEIRRLNPDVVILDIRMPGGSGIDVLQGMNEDNLNPVVIMLSNCSAEQYRRTCIESGARFYFDKSAEFHKVAETLRGLMGSAVA